MEQIFVRKRIIYLHVKGLVKIKNLTFLAGHNDSLKNCAYY